MSDSDNRTTHCWAGWTREGDHSMTFKQLREANRKHFNDASGARGGRPAVHEWMAVVGTISAAANIIERLHDDEMQTVVGRRLGDALVALDVLADRLGVDLGEAVRERLNAIVGEVAKSE